MQLVSRPSWILSKIAWCDSMTRFYVTRRIALWRVTFVDDICRSMSFMNSLEKRMIWHNNIVLSEMTLCSVACLIYILYTSYHLFHEYSRKVHDMTQWLSSMRHDALPCDVTHLDMIYVVSRPSWILSKSAWYDSITQLYVTWLIILWHDSFILDVCVTWLITLWHDSFIHDIGRITSSMSGLEERMIWHMDSFSRDMIHCSVLCLIYVWCQSYHFLHECSRKVHDMTQWLSPKWHTHCSVTWLIYTRLGLYHVPHDCPRRAHDMTHGLISTWQDSLLCDVSHLYMTWVVSRVSRNLSKSAWYDPMTQSYVAWLIALWRDSFRYDVCVTWLIALWHDAFFFMT